MQVNGLSHVNIVAADIGASVTFYESVLGLTAQPIPNAPANFVGRWLIDANGQPIIHVQAYNPERHAASALGTTTGSIDHVALDCSDFAGTIRRCEELGVDHRINHGRVAGLRQVFLTDPDNVTLELNFAGD